MAKKINVTNLLDTTKIAKKMGVTNRAVLARAEARGIEPTLVVGRSQLWSPEAVKAITADLTRGRKKESP